MLGMQSESGMKASCGAVIQGLVAAAFTALCLILAVEIDFRAHSHLHQL